MTSMERKRVGLALSGGGARGFAHVGVLRVLEENGIEIDMIAGTSAGSIVGGALATGMSAAEIYDLGKKVGWFNMTGFSYSPRGLLTNKPMGDFLAANLPVHQFEDLMKPFSAVAYDMENSKAVVMKEHGDLITAIRASCAVPGVFVPVIDNEGRSLVDGGVVSPMPTKEVKKLGADVIIAVDVLSCGSSFRHTPKTLVGTFIQAAMTLVRTASINQHYRADIVIEPQIAHIRPDEIRRMDELVSLGEEAALAMIDEIKAIVST